MKFSIFATQKNSLYLAWASFRNVLTHKKNLPDLGIRRTYEAQTTEGSSHC